MGIIDLNFETPASEREERGEVVEEPSSGGPEAADRRRGRTLLKTVGALAIGLLGTITLRKLRNRGKRDTGPGE